MEVKNPAGARQLSLRLKTPRHSGRSENSPEEKLSMKLLDTPLNRPVNWNCVIIGGSPELIKHDARRRLCQNKLGVESQWSTCSGLYFRHRLVFVSAPRTQIKVEKCEMRLNVELHVVRRRARHVKQFEEWKMSEPHVNVITPCGQKYVDTDNIDQIYKIRLRRPRACWASSAN